MSQADFAAILGICVFWQDVVLITLAAAATPLGMCFIFVSVKLSVFFEKNVVKEMSQSVR